MDQEVPRPRLAELRKARGETQTDVARIAGCTQENVSKWEAGRHPMPLPTAVRLARHFGVTIDELMGLGPAVGEAA
jgi:putative transcriptional regulator